MSIKPVVIYGDEALHVRGAEITEFDDELRALIADMFDTMDAANGVGLAAPQIGVPLRLFTFAFEHDDEAPSRGVVVNPVLTLSKVSQANPDPEEDEEGCLSAPGLAFPLKRASYARVQGFDGDGNPVDFEATDWFARIMQHEYDHLDGFLYVDKLNERWTKRWKKAKKTEGWGVPGLSWTPGVDPDPFGH
ncbi:peptide deformylase [Paeniglutamicibacter cryotolerans]|uniref:Peptide deformylase n=1 Tax=Paeniglutamicibacter cryotolerans TaxID=670079 RepID=A0A839QN46_9MICC|nr:peptide deformylase [Paeniglutamicibacter cryotolerans]MBB2997327.1 peptide deformylase [Paeniglutamicibacter cryotolerans]